MYEPLNTANNFWAGKLSQCLPVWETITSDKWILDTVAGYKIEFCENATLIARRKAPHNVSSQTMDSLLREFLEKNIIEQSVKSGGFFSSVFLVEKRDLSFRAILNLKDLNQSVEHHHFKMDTIKDAICLIRENCFFGSVDLKDSYFSVPVHPLFREYLKFYWNGEAFQFTCLPQGLSSAPRVFTKLLKPVFALLRKHGHSVVGFIDDSLLVAESQQELLASINSTVKLLDSLGFTINMSKSVLQPTQNIEFLGFILDSSTMTVSLADRKKQKIKALCTALKLKQNCKIREFAQLIGNLVAAVPAVEFAPLYIKRLEMEKNSALKATRGDFDGSMAVSNRVLEDINWWFENIDLATKAISKPEPSLIIQSDASTKGWGGVLLDPSLVQLETAGGRWSEYEALDHINYLELLACFMVLKSFLSKKESLHCHVQLDNTTAVACLNKMGSTKEKLFELTKRIWIWCHERNIWLSVSHLPGVQNCLADRESRVFNDDTEWALDLHIFEQICQVFGVMNIDLFASRLNYKIQPYVSWRPDPIAKAIDAFSMIWKHYYAYMFPPFSVLGAVLQKLQQEEATAVLVFPLWPTRPWFPVVLRMLIQGPKLLPRTCLYLPHDPGRRHPLENSMVMAVAKLSGNTSLVRDFQNQLPKYCATPGETPQDASIGRISSNGCSFVLKNKLILFSHL